MQPLVLNPQRQVNVVPLSDEGALLIIIDDVVSNPECIHDFAENTAYLQPAINDGTAYPGVRDRMPRSYDRLLQELLATLNLTNEEHPADIHRCMLSLVTTLPEQLASTQKVPHVDSIDLHEFACVHYFFDKSLGGTGIYRHKNSGKLCIDASCFDVFESVLSEVRDNPDEFTGYIEDSNRLFERAYAVEAKYNRMVIYKGNMLHSPNLGGNFSFSDDVTKGRLSVASFFRIE